MKKCCAHPHHHHGAGHCDAAEGGRELSSLTSQLRREARKVTGPRAAILEILRSRPHPLTNGEIFRLLPAGQCNLATVYRATALLEKLGMVKQFDFGDGAARYELMREGDDGHHHHLVCTRCAAVVELEECFATDIQQRIATHHNFVAVTHRLEFFGVCPACQKPAAGTGPEAGRRAGQKPRRK